jgi:hypothetical protein
LFYLGSTHKETPVYQYLHRLLIVIYNPLSILVMATI